MSGWGFPSACFFVQPAPATKRSFASGRIVCSPEDGARSPTTFVRVAPSAETASFSTAGAAPPSTLAAGYAPGSTRSTQGRSLRRSFASMRCL